jgi:hypothetical protein
VFTGQTKIFAAFLIAVLLPACSHEIPEYESKYVPDQSLDVSERARDAAAEPLVSFVDRFESVDTKFGIGQGWDLIGPGFIKDRAFTYAGDGTVYATRQFRGAVQRIGTVGQWRRLKGGQIDTTMAMAIAPNNLPSSLLRFTANRAGWALTPRRGFVDLEPVAKGQFSPPLTLNTEFVFEIEARDNSVTVRVPGDEVTTKVDLTGLIGNNAVWEESPDATPADVVFDFFAVWAAEAGQKLVPLYEA